MRRSITSDYKRVVKVINNYYATNRREFPWRAGGVRHKKVSPYAILVSELMLQQTQVDRVIPYYHAWCKRFPTVAALSQATLSEVLLLWQGLGYNRRAKYLLESARLIMSRHRGKVPTTIEALTALPGIGTYTAGAVLSFAYNQPSVLLETNIRTVLIHFFYEGVEKVSEKELLATAHALWKVAEGIGMDAREWGYALMDYGAYLKKSGSNHVARSHHYKAQSVFKGSTRQTRGAIIKELTTSTHTLSTLSNKIKKEKSSVEKALHSLVRDGLVTKKGARYLVATS